MTSYITLVNSAELTAIIDRLRDNISSEYQGKSWTALVVLNGAFFFASELLLGVDSDVYIEFAKVSSYVGQKSSEVISSQLLPKLKTKEILIVEDICETGMTLEWLKKYYVNAGHNVKTCCLFNKPNHRKVSVALDFTGKALGDEYVIGYGFDIDGKYRQLKQVCVMDELE